MLLNVQEIARRIQIDFIEWPMLRVTLPQACRLWNTPAGLCEEALLTLVRTDFLLDRDGLFHRPVRAAFFDNGGGRPVTAVGADHSMPLAS